MKKAWVIFILIFSASCSQSGADAKKISADDIRISGENSEKQERSELIKKRNSIRLYDGAPPVIPHRLDEAFSDYQSCMNCHKVGGMHGPNVLHKNQVNCTQCHVKIKTDTVFRESNFKKYYGVRKFKRSNPIGPPYIPHRVQDRKNCAICHIANGAKEELVPRHGNLMNCVQCHVQLQRTKTDYIQNKDRN